jgi:hypothetical protein
MTLRITLVALLLTAVGAAAQGPPQNPQPTRPTYSPYLNLLRNNVPAYQNYYGLVQPQVQQQQQLNNLQSQFTGLQNATAALAFPGTGNELSTGKQVAYFTHRQYFFNQSGVQLQRPVSGQMGLAGNNSVYGQGNGNTVTGALPNMNLNNGYAPQNIPRFGR